MLRRSIWLAAFVLFAAAAGSPACTAQSSVVSEDLLITAGETGSSGGRLVIAQRAEPRTLQPLFAVDAPSREVIRLMTADLIHINRNSQQTEPALAKSWTVSQDGLRYDLLLRRGLQFSDGHPMDADDVVFSFQVCLDENVHSPQRDLLLVADKPLRVSKLGPYAVRFELSEPYAAAERLFDGIAILPRHLLLSAYKEGKLAQAWSLTTNPGQIAGLGPFRLKQYIPGDRIILERNPFYWKTDRNGHRLPYLEEVVLLSVGNEDAQVIRFQAGETDLLSRASAENFGILSKEQQGRGYRLYDLGPGLEYSFLFFNLNDLKNRALPEVARKQEWFRLDLFRQAVSAAIDRDAMVRLAFQGRATPLFGHVTPGNGRWLNSGLPKPARSLSKARALLASAGFKWRSDGVLLDSHGQVVEFTIATSAGNTSRMQMATMIQADLNEIGMQVHVAEIEFRSLLDRILKSADYEACVLSLASTDADPNPELNVLVSGGGTHLWHPSQKEPATAWEAEIDRLMHRQMSVTDYAERKRLYDRVQEVMAEKLPLIYLASPNILVGANANLGNFKPAVLDPYTLWNVEELYWRTARSGASHD